MNQNIAIFQRTFCTTRENNLLFRPQQQQILKSHHPDATTAQDFQLSVNGKSSQFATLFVAQNTKKSNATF